MPRMAINIEADHAPATHDWTRARTVIWLLLLVMLGFWGTLIVTSTG